MSSTHSNRVGSAEGSPEDLRRLLIAIAEAVMGWPHSLEYLAGLVDDEVPEELKAVDRVDAVAIAGFGFEEDGYRFRIERISETEHSDDPVAATRVYGPKVS